MINRIKYAKKFYNDFVSGFDLKWWQKCYMGMLVIVNYRRIYNLQVGLTIWNKIMNCKKHEVKNK